MLQRILIKSLTFCLCTILTITIWQLPLALGKPYRDRFNEPKCTDSSTGRELFVGDAFSRPGQCVRVQCLVNLQLWEDRCQEPKLQGNCTRMPPANEYVEYPRCCPMYECKTYQTNEHGQIEETRTYDRLGTLRRTKITQIFFVTDPLKSKLPGSGIRTQFNI